MDCSFTFDLIVRCINTIELLIIFYSPQDKRQTEIISCENGKMNMIDWNTGEVH